MNKVNGFPKIVLFLFYSTSVCIVKRQRDILIPVCEHMPQCDIKEALVLLIFSCVIVYLQMRVFAEELRGGVHALGSLTLRQQRHPDRD